MKLLVDENLPLRLGRDCGVEVAHSTGLGARMSDSQLWDRALAEGAILVTKDVDFFQRCLLCRIRPKIIWIRVGNLRRHEMEKLFHRTWPLIEPLLGTADLIEIWQDRVEAITF